MRPDLAAMSARVACAREEWADNPPSPGLRGRIDDLLTEGYACALSGDSWAIAAEREFHELLSDHDAPVRGDSVRALARDQAVFQRELIALRRELAALRSDRDRLLAASAPRSA